MESLFFSFVFDFFLSVSLKVSILSLDFSGCHMFDQHVVCVLVIVCYSGLPATGLSRPIFLTRVIFFMVSSSYSFLFSLPCFRNLASNLSFFVSFPVVGLAYPCFSARGILSTLFWLAFPWLYALRTKQVHIWESYMAPNQPGYAYLGYSTAFCATYVIGTYLGVVFVFYRYGIYVLALPQLLHHARHRCLLRRRIIFLYHALWYMFSGPSPVFCTRTPLVLFEKFRPPRFRHIALHKSLLLGCTSMRFCV